MAVVRHADRICLVAPWDRDESRTKDLLAREPPVVGGIGEHGRDREIPLAQRSFLWRQPAKYETALLAPNALSI